jgi:disulfide bond formation protein DsbB
MKELIQNLLPYAVLISHFVFVLILLAFIFRRSWGREMIQRIRKHSLGLGLLVSSVAIIGSLFYSNIVGFVPCDLCWWQRIFLYPQLVLFIVAFKARDKDVFRFTLPLSVIAVIISIYHSYVQISGNSLLPCSATATCTKVYVLAFNYVTIPMMALTIGAYLLLLSIIVRTTHE